MEGKTYPAKLLPSIDRIRDRFESSELGEVDVLDTMFEAASRCEDVFYNRKTFLAERRALNSPFKPLFEESKALVSSHRVAMAEREEVETESFPLSICLR